MVGILSGITGSGIVFTSWDNVEEGLSLKPISAPDSPIEEDEEDEAGLFSAFD